MTRSVKWGIVRPIAWGIVAALVALVAFTVAGGPPPQAGTVLPQKQSGPLFMG